MPIIPPTITALASSKKAVNFWVLLGIVLMRNQIDVPLDWFKWLVVAYCAYAIGQGFADMHKECEKVKATAASEDVVIPDEPEVITEKKV